MINSSKLLYLKGMDFADALPKEWRQFIHEYNVPIAKVFIEAGVTNPNNAHQIINTIRSHYLGHRVETRKLGKSHGVG